MTMATRQPATRAGAEVRWDVATPELLQELVGAPLPLGMRHAAVEHGFHRDVFLDTEDHWLHGQGVTCRFRVTSDDRRLLTLSVRGPAIRGNTGTVLWQRYDAETPELDALVAVQGASESARRVRAMIDPARLREIGRASCRERV